MSEITYIKHVITWETFQHWTSIFLSFTQISSFVQAYLEGSVSLIFVCSVPVSLDSQRFKSSTSNEKENLRNTICT